MVATYNFGSGYMSNQYVNYSITKSICMSVKPLFCILTAYYFIIHFRLT